VAVAENQVKDLNDCIKHACKETPPLKDALAKTTKIAGNDFKVKVPVNRCRELEKAVYAVSGKELKQTEAKSERIANIMTRNHNCLTVPRDIF